MNKTQLIILRKIIKSEKGKTSRELAEYLKKTQSHISYTLSKLVEEGFLEKKKTRYYLSDNLHAQDLKEIIYESNTRIEDILSQGKLEVLTELLEKKKPKELVKHTSLEKSSIYDYKKKFREYGIIKDSDNKIEINEKLWPKLKKFLQHYKEYKEKTDSRIPSNAQILYKDEEKIIFQYPYESDATLTAFSRFSNYGIKTYMNTNIYRLPKKELTIKDIYVDALDISHDYREYMLCLLFYLKNKINVDHEKHKDILEHLKRGNKEYLPPLDEIRQKAEEYYDSLDEKLSE